jgi:hypothetical protein
VDQPPERDRRIRELERRFRSAGLPLLAEDYSATEDVFNRAIPLLAVVFVLEILGAINLDWPAALNVLALLGGVALVLVAFGLLNVSRARSFLVSDTHREELEALTRTVVDRQASAAGPAIPDWARGRFASSLSPMVCGPYAGPRRSCAAGRSTAEGSRSGATRWRLKRLSLPCGGPSTCFPKCKFRRR